MLKIYVDADACPVKQEILKVAERYELPVFLVSNQWLRLPVGPTVEKVVVGQEFDAADTWIADRVEQGDLCITGDILLAERCLAKGAEAMGHGGKAFTSDNIGMAVAMRELKSQLRDMGEDRGYNRAFTKSDRSSFLSALDLWYHRARKK